MISSKKPTKIGTVLDSYFANPDFKTIVKGLAIHTIWQKAVGANITKRAQPLKLIERTLYVNVSTSPWMEELKYMKGDIIKKVNNELHEEAVKDIIFRIGKITELGDQKPEIPNPKHKSQLSQKEMTHIESMVRHIKDGELKEAVRKAIVSSYKGGN